MNFMSFLKSLDDLLYEVATWLIFYPVTLWRTIRHPWRMMRYADSELADAPDRQFDDALRPTLFLFLTLLLGHGIELAVAGQSSLVASRAGLAALITDDTTLLLSRLLIFGLLPLVTATFVVRARGARLTRDTLREPFYSQCYLAAPFALAIGVGTLLAARQAATGLALVAAALLWLVLVEAHWFARELSLSRLRGAAMAIGALLLWFLAVVLIGLLTV